MQQSEKKLEKPIKKTFGRIKDLKILFDYLIIVN